jgi:hypothetical protein
MPLYAFFTIFVLLGIVPLSSSTSNDKFHETNGAKKVNPLVVNVLIAVIHMRRDSNLVVKVIS